MMSDLYLVFVYYIIPAAMLIPVLAGIIKYKALTKPFKIIFWFSVFSNTINLINLIIIRFGYNSIAIINLYTIFEFIFLGLFYSEFFEKRGRRIITALMVIFTLLCLFNYFFIQNKIEFNTYTRPIGAIMLIVLSMLFILKQNNDDESWAENKYNWPNAGILLYFASCLFMFIFSNYLLSSSQIVNRVVWSIHDIIMIFEYILFAVGFNKCKTQQTISTY